jgi:hypothetical protein
MASAFAAGAVAMVTVSIDDAIRWPGRAAWWSFAAMLVSTLVISSWIAGQTIEQREGSRRPAVVVSMLCIAGLAALILISR